MMQLERRHHPLLPPMAFAVRMAMFTLVSLAIVALSLAMGMVGFHVTEKMGWLDCLLNASMLLGGMGPVATPQSDAGKYFASFYALYSGLIVLVAFGVLVTPVAHRIFHRFHLPEDEDEAKALALRSCRGKGSGT